MRYRLQRHDGTDCSATMVPITVLRMVPIQRYRHSSCDFPSYLSFPHGLLEMKRGYSSCPVIFYIQKVNAQS